LKLFEPNDRGEAQERVREKKQVGEEEERSSFKLLTKLD
jgi:hypothetical protein